MQVRSRGPLSRRAPIRFSGIPHRPNPEIMMEAPSGMSRTADAASGTTLFMVLAIIAEPIDGPRPAADHGSRGRGGRGTSMSPRYYEPAPGLPTGEEPRWPGLTNADGDRGADRDRGIAVNTGQDPQRPGATNRPGPRSDPGTSADESPSTPDRPEEPRPDRGRERRTDVEGATGNDR